MSGAGETLGALATEDLTKTFGRQTAVDHLTLRVEPGEVFGFLGPNGAGKTTTVRLLCGLISPTSGSVRVGRLDLTRPDEALEARRRIGLLPENVGLYEELSPMRNLDYFAQLYDRPADERATRIEHLLRWLELWDQRDRPVATFSKGMKQKVAIARALVHDPELLFLDEPTANLDPESARNVRELLLELKKERRTVFLTTHNLDEAQRVCDRIGVMKTRLLKVGAPSELKASLWGARTTIRVDEVTDRILAAVRALVGAERLSVEGTNLVVSVTNPDAENPQLVEAITAAGGRIRSVSELAPSLEDVYLRLVRG